MELLFISLGGAILGIAAYYAFGHRQVFGAILIPAIGTAVAAAIWEALTWAGLKWNGGWIWWITLLVTAAVVSLADLGLAHSRDRADAALLAALTKTGGPA